MTSKNIPSWHVWKETHLPVYSGCLASSGFMYQIPNFLLCTIPVLDLRCFGAGDSRSCSWWQISSWNDDSSCFCYLSLDLFSLSELDMSSWQLACKGLPYGPISQSTLSYTFPNLSHPFQFNDFNFSFSQAPWVILSMESVDSHGFPQLRRHSKFVEDMILMIQ